MIALCSRELTATQPPGGTRPRMTRLSASVAFLVKASRCGSRMPNSAAHACRAWNWIRLASRARRWLARPGLPPASVRQCSTASATPGALGKLVAALSR
jgi:hypothetical protein